VEGLADAAVVRMQTDHQRLRVVGQNPAYPTGVRLVHQMLDAEHIRVPVDAGLEVADRQRDVVHAYHVEVGHGHSFLVRWLRAFARQSRFAGQSPDAIPHSVRVRAYGG
jgi:hypothetical protein